MDTTKKLTPKQQAELRLAVYEGRSISDELKNDLIELGWLNTALAMQQVIQGGTNK